MRKKWKSIISENKKEDFFRKDLSSWTPGQPLDRSWTPGHSLDSHWTGSDRYKILSFQEFDTLESRTCLVSVHECRTCPVAVQEDKSFRKQNYDYLKQKGKIISSGRKFQRTFRGKRRHIYLSGRICLPGQPLDRS